LSKQQASPRLQGFDTQRSTAAHSVPLRPQSASAAVAHLSTRDAQTVPNEELGSEPGINMQPGSVAHPHGVEKRRHGSLTITQLRLTTQPRSGEPAATAHA
jgi:hypothetical protein